LEDATLGLFNEGLQQINFYHQYTQDIVSFKAFLTSYQENWRNVWEEKELVRRLNKQYTFNAVYRTIQIGWDLPSYDEEEAQANLENCTKFVRMLYPKVDEHGVVIGPNPVWFMSLMNLVHNGAHATGGSFEAGTGMAYSGLKGFPANFTWQPILEEGVFSAPGFILPKLIRVSCDYNVLVDETQRFGWYDGGEGSTAWTQAQSWPWGVNPDMSGISPIGGDSGLSTLGNPDEPSATEDSFGLNIMVDDTILESIGLGEGEQ